MARIAFNLPQTSAPAAAPGPVIDVETTDVQQAVTEASVTTEQPPAVESEADVAAQIAALQARLAAKRAPQPAPAAPTPPVAAPTPPTAVVTPPPAPAPAAAPAAQPTAAPVKSRKGPRKAAKAAPEPTPAPAAPPAPPVAPTPPAAPAAPAEIHRPVVASATPQAPPLTTRNVHQTVNAPPAGSQQLVTRESMFQDDGGSGIDYSDLVLPRLNIVQKVGDLSEVFEPGTIVLGKTVALDQPLKLAVVSFAPKRYVEKIPGGQTQGRMAKSTAEVVNMGGTIDYNEAKETGRPLFQTLSTALCIVERGADDPAEAFPFEFQGKFYTLVLWSMKGTSYTNAAKYFFTARKTGLFKTSRSAMVNGFLRQFVTLETESKSYNAPNGKVWAMIPIVEVAGETSDTFRAWVHNMMSGGSEADAGSGE